MLSTLAAMVISSGSVTAPAPAAEEPYLAVRTGLKCSACHVNRTGGGGRNAFGSVFAQTQLPARAGATRNRALNDYLAIGFDVRAVASAGVYLRFLDRDPPPATPVPRTAVELEEANAYLEARLIDRVVALYVDETLGPTRATTREAFILLETSRLNGYLKAGKFLLPYGWRLQDDAEFIRQGTEIGGTGFSYDTPDQGVEVGIEPGRLSWFAALTNGTAGAAEVDDGKQLTSSLAVTFRHFRLGVSASRNEAAGRPRRDVVGTFGGLSVGRLAVLGEVDRISNRFLTGPDTTQIAAYAEADFLVTRGLNLKGTYGYFDKSRVIPEDERVRARLGIEWFPNGFLRAAAFYTADVWIPQATTDIDRVSVELQLHF